MQKERLINNWRSKIGTRTANGELNWRVGLYKEFMNFVEEVGELAQIYKWNLWGGGTDNYAVTLSQSKRNGKSISIKMIGSDKYHYYVSFANEWNPNRIDSSEYKECIGNTLDDALKYLHEFLKDNKYDLEFNDLPRIDYGCGYDKCYMRIRWAKEELVDQLMKEEISL